MSRTTPSVEPDTLADAVNALTEQVRRVADVFVRIEREGTRWGAVPNEPEPRHRPAPRSWTGVEGLPGHFADEAAREDFNARR